MARVKIKMIITIIVLLTLCRSVASLPCRGLSLLSLDGIQPKSLISSTNLVSKCKPLIILITQLGTLNSFMLELDKEVKSKIIMEMIVVVKINNNMKQKLKSLMITKNKLSF